MLFLNDVNLKDYNLSNDFRFKGLSMRLAPEVYICLEEKGLCFPLHPEDHNSAQKYFFKSWPSSQDWKELFQFYGLNNEFDFCRYVNSVLGSETLEISEKWIQELLQSYGYSSQRYAEIDYIATLDGFRKELFIQKKIPVKLLKLLDQVSEKSAEALSRILLMKQTNGNIGREILGNWLDLEEHKRTDVLNYFDETLRTASAESLSAVSDTFREYLQRQRFPRLNSMRQEIENLTEQLPRKIHVDYDKTLESNELTIFFKFDDIIQLKNRINEIGQEETIRILEQLTILLNRA